MLQHCRSKPRPSEYFDNISEASIDWDMLGGRCLAQKHDQIISTQKSAIVSLRDTISTLEETSTTGNNMPGFALQRISSLKKANEALEGKLANEILSSKRNLLDVADQKLYDEACRLNELLEANKRELKEEKSIRRQTQEDLHQSEEIYFKCIRDLNSELDLKHVFGRVPITDGSDRKSIVKERNKGIEVILNNIKSLKARVRRQDELFVNYDKDMKNLRDLEAKFNKMTYHVKYMESEIEEKGDEIAYLQEALKKSRNECADLKRLNSSLKLNKKFAMDHKKK